MSDHHQAPPDHLVINVQHRDDPVSLVTEADAFAAARTYGNIAARGPLFGIAEQRRGERPRWRLRTTRWRRLIPKPEEGPGVSWKD